MGKSVLVINSGSSSLKYALYNMGSQARLAVNGLVEQIGSERSSVTHTITNEAKSTVSQRHEIPDHKSALKQVINFLHLDRESASVAAVGHRVVHGGESVNRPMLITDYLKKTIEKSIPLAPLHNPPNLEGIKVAQELFTCPQVAIFDTAFHSSMPPAAFTYALPFDLYTDHKIRRYGFHGTSYLYLTRETAKFLNKPVEDLNAIILHLGAGASIAAIRNGRSVDTSMGCTPLEGLVMATRSGDVDPAIGTILSSLRGLDSKATDSLLNKKSGLFGICGEKDMKTIVEKAAEGVQQYKLALDIFSHRIRKYLGAYLLELGGKVDAIVFSAGIGERSAPIRKLICKDLEAFGIVLDDGKNEAKGSGDREVQADGSRIKILVVPTDEELCIAQQTWEVVQELEKGKVNE